MGNRFAVGLQQRTIGGEEGCHGVFSAKPKAAASIHVNASVGQRRARRLIGAAW